MRVNRRRYAGLFELVQGTVDLDTILSIYLPHFTDVATKDMRYKVGWASHRTG